MTLYAVTLRQVPCLVACLFMMALCPAAQADFNFDTDGDLFDLGRGTTVIDSSSLNSSVAESLVSLTTGGVEEGTVLFSDGSDGTVHFIEFQTASPVTVAGFNLWANGDAPSFPERRAFEHFTLKAKIGQNFEIVYDEDVDVPYEGNEGEDFLVVSTPVAPVTASVFRAEFTQHGSGPDTGPRVQELDAFPPKLCGDANYDGNLTTTDALSALRTAVGTAKCVRCVCNVNNMSGINTTDALLILKRAVGQSVPMECFTCVVGEAEPQ